MADSSMAVVTEFSTRVETLAGGGIGGTSTEVAEEPTSTSTITSTTILWRYISREGPWQASLLFCLPFGLLDGLFRNLCIKSIRLQSQRPIQALPFLCQGHLL
ncbi:hypothetical protein SCUP234_07429 [Seiridium cupressi]